MVVSESQEISLEVISLTNDVGRFLVSSLSEKLANPPVHTGQLQELHVQALLHACLRGQTQASVVVHQWLASGVDIEDVYLQGITPVARLVGQWWCDDDIDFASATLAFVRLRQLVNELSPLFLLESASRKNGLSCLMVGNFQTQHTLGLFMLSEFFKRHGWQVRSDECDSGKDLLQMVSSDWHDLLAISLSCENQAEQMRRLIPYIRKNSANPHLKIMAGGPLFSTQPHAVKNLEIDVMTHDARTAQKIAFDLVCPKQTSSQHELTLVNVN